MKHTGSTNTAADGFPVTVAATIPGRQRGEMALKGARLHRHDYGVFNGAAPD
jgi:hypothetical protein